MPQKVDVVTKQGLIQGAGGPWHTIFCIENNCIKKLAT